MPHSRLHGRAPDRGVGRVAGLAGVTVRALHHYDEIGLVRPSARTAAGYRAYSASDVERLRDVLAYRRLGFGLREIADLVDDPSTDAIAHLLLASSLSEHRSAELSEDDSARFREHRGRHNHVASLSATLLARPIRRSGQPRGIPASLS
jgi:DNA-binding transcriptional MerR regulator